MTEPEILSEFSDNKMNTTLTDQINNKLPKLSSPQSRNQPRSKAEPGKTLASLPRLKQNASDTVSNQQKGSVENERNDFALQIEERLKLVIQNVNHGQLQEDSEGQSDIDFEELVEQNKEKIKQKKQKAESKPNHQGKEQRKEVKSKSKTMKISRNDNSLYEKRMKQFREASTENKYIMKKKELLAQRQQMIEKAVEKTRIARQHKEDPTIKLNKETEDIRQLQKDLNYLQNYNINSTKLGKNLAQPRTILKTKLSIKNILKEEQNIPKVPHQQSKTTNLFDNIHNLLQNPNKLRAASEMKKSNAHNIKALEERIKMINKKLGVEQTIDLQIKKSQIQQKTVSDWKRIDYKQGSDFSCHYDSNFEKEVQKIGALQEKNNHYLAQLVTHQKTLVQLTMIKKLQPTITTQTN